MNIHCIYGPLFRMYRSRRLMLFYSLFKPLENETLLDVGGSSYFWKLCRELGLTVPRVTILNLGTAPSGLDPQTTWIVGDACKLPFADLSFDYIFSNSVIEHVGDEESQMKMANEIRRVGCNYFVQTPDRHFPFEPHLLTPFIHWMPPRAYERLVPRFTVRHWLNGAPEDDVELSGIRLLDRRQMQCFFPDSHIRTERTMGFSKSLIAYRGGIES